MSLISNLVQALTTKAAAVVAASALVVGGGVAATAATGSPNPVNWGQAVVQQVQACKAEPASEAPAASRSRDNVGQCVSSFAKQHASEARENHPTPEASESPEAIGTPKAEKSPEPKETPEAKESPEAAESPRAKQSPEADGPGASDKTGVRTGKPSPKPGNGGGHN